MKIVKCILSLAFLALTVGSCKKSSFVSVNSDPNTLYKVDPADQFLAAASGCQDDFEYYYDVYRALNYWLQYSTNQTGNALGFMNPSSNFNERYAKIFYGRVGSYLSDIPHLVANMTEDEQAKRVYQVSIAAIFKAYYAFYVSDINGSIPYSEAFQARYGGTLYPKYDRQQDLFDTLDLQIKNAVHTLETSQPVTQTLYDAKDPFYGTAADQVKEWIAAGNALRLKIALRLMKQDPAKLQAIATEVVADPNQMSDNSDGWVLLVGPNFANATGNYN
ncbi:MAG TPA: SusD/RagB family nutrient-binding outer membrane lipoprotein, partial [Puia sp.]|nr:SusD/RagB family nutrient-binding outer membrane lipoprotein [Puia sp.]